MAVLSDDMGGITAYAAAVNRGYTGTKEEFEQLMYSYTEVAERAEAAAGNAHESEEATIEAKDIAVSAKNEAVSARDAAVSARDASISAKNDSQSARDAAISAKNDTLAAKDAVMSAKGSVDETSANFSDAVTAAISDVNAAGRNQKELAKTHAIDSEAWAVGQREGADVGVSDETYHNNSKYYAEQSALAKSETEIARDTAITAKDNAVAAKNEAETAKGQAQDIVDGINAKSEQIEQNTEDISALQTAISTKAEVDNTLTIAGRAADAKKTGDEISELKEDLLRLETIIPIIAGRGKTWAEIKQNVKMGYGEILYPVGTEFEVECPSGAPYNSIIFVVVDHRVESGEHIMTMFMKHVIYSTEFDAIQAIICPEETMQAGTYHFALLSGYDTAYDGGKNVQFTLANDLEAGGQIVMNWPYNQTWIGKNLTAYHAFGTSAIETCVMSEGTSGTDLGVADGTVSILNHTHRARYGSNNYKESAIRNWLDSDDAANTWQTQQTRFQRPCSYRTRAGFVTYLDPEFVAVIREGTHPNRTNEIFDLNGKKQAYSTTDKFYLASQEEIGFSSESGIVCGTVFDFYNGAAQSDKIKYDITAQTTARHWWLRTPYPSYANLERYVTSSGALHIYPAYLGFGASAACEI